ncbi:ABC transporter permease subunit [Streptomyces sp. P17]|uniref:amino acid ABC transporter permease n=1 Tax=Streptomyces sp. P17 TaxID=3074716 RepID=UPI0028F4025B|nr:ABC transporter permease subunit [Streptomyces sp. P17]MDT9697953.1 ABC transporter permease subunit [Streptomyces sp. P17]
MTAVLYDAMGPRARRRVHLGTAVGAVLAAGLLAVVLTRLSSHGQLSADRWSILFNADLRDLLLEGLLATARVAGVSLILSLGFGMLLACGRLAPQRWLRAPLRVWVEVFRGLPLLLLIFFIFLGAPALGMDVSTFWALTLGITLYQSAVMSEIIRAGILSLPRGQSEAAAAIGLGGAATMRIIVLPQAVRLMLPALISQMVVLLKETSLGFIIGYTELLRNGRIAVEYLGGAYAIPVYTGIALVYLVVNLLLSALARTVDRRTRR